jgi:hypothetical protein
MTSADCARGARRHQIIRGSDAILNPCEQLADSKSAPCCGLNFLKPGLVESRATVIIPFDDRVIFVGLFNCAEFSSRLSEVAQTLDAISGIQFLVGGRGLGERWPFGTVGVRSRPWV